MTVNIIVIFMVLNLQRNNNFSRKNLLILRVDCGWDARGGGEGGGGGKT